MYTGLKQAIEKLAGQGDVVDYLVNHGYINRQTGELRSRSCPVAQYLRDETGQTDLSVACDYVGTYDAVLFEELPGNINNAIDHFDQLTYTGEEW